jgi:mannose-6-phosphate isomerase
MNGKHEGKTLKWLYDNEPNYFGYEDERRWEIIPVGMGCSWAATNLSVQVHPREDWSMKHLGTHGKSECWYFPETEPNNTVVFGHNAQSWEELDDYISRGDWEGLIKRHPIQPGSFYAIKGGTLHSIQKGCYFIEICNPNPVTYRFYDWNRVDSDGKPRPLDIEKAKENLILPDSPIIYDEIITQYGDVVERFMADNEDYAAWLYTINGEGIVPRKKPFCGCFVIYGEGSVCGIDIKAGQSFMVTRSCEKIIFKGNMTIIACHG